MQEKWIIAWVPSEAGRTLKLVVRYRENATENGQIVRQQKCVKLADYFDSYRTKSDLADLAAEKLAASKKPTSVRILRTPFSNYVEHVYLAFRFAHQKALDLHGYKNLFQEIPQTESREVRFARFYRGGRFLTA